MRRRPWRTRRPKTSTSSSESTTAQANAREDVTETLAGRGREGALGALDSARELVAGIPETIRRRSLRGRHDGAHYAANHHAVRRL